MRAMLIWNGASFAEVGFSSVALVSGGRFGTGRSRRSPDHPRLAGGNVYLSKHLLGWGRGRARALSTSPGDCAVLDFLIRHSRQSQRHRQSLRPMQTSG